MLWALIVSIILKTQVKPGDSDVNHNEIAEHTPGFYAMEPIRLQRYMYAMDKKLASAVARHEKADATLFQMAHKGKSSAVQNRAFYRLIASEKRIIRTRKCIHNIGLDYAPANATNAGTNEQINQLYELAYSNKFELLKHLLKAHAK